MPMRGFFIDNGAFEKYSHRISARRMLTILRKASDSTMFPDDPAKGDKLFVPKTPQEAEYWKILRDEIKQSANKYLASRENGKRGGRPSKTSTEPPQPTQSLPKPDLLTPAQKADAIANMTVSLGKKLSDKSPYQTLLVSSSLDLTKLTGPVGDMLRLMYPPNRSNTLSQLSDWLRTKMLGEKIDTQWLYNQAKKFYSKNNSQKFGIF